METGNRWSRIRVLAVLGLLLNIVVFVVMNFHGGAMIVHRLGWPLGAVVLLVVIALGIALVIITVQSLRTIFKGALPRQ